MERHQAGVRGHRPVELRHQPRLHRGGHHPPDHGHHARALLRQAVRHQEDTGDSRQVRPQGHLRRRARLRGGGGRPRHPQRGRHVHPQLPRHEGVQHDRGRGARGARREDQAADRLPEELRVRRRDHGRGPGHQRQDGRGALGSGTDQPQARRRRDRGKTQSGHRLP